MYQISIEFFFSVTINANKLVQLGTFMYDHFYDVCSSGGFSQRFQRGHQWQIYPFFRAVTIYFYEWNISDYTFFVFRSAIFSGVTCAIGAIPLRPPLVCSMFYLNELFEFFGFSVQVSYKITILLESSLNPFIKHI